MSLSRRWQQQGRKEEARQRLAEIYNWVTEGFDTKKPAQYWKSSPKLMSRPL